MLFRTTTNATILAFTALAVSCSHQTTDEFNDEILHGTISYPFPRTNPLGVNGQKEKFVIRAIKGQMEYVVEFPSAGEDYDIEVPVAELADGATPEAEKRPPNTSKTDQEMTAALPDAGDKDREQTNLMDSAFGVAREGAADQGPSYALGLAKATELYHKNQLELALIEVNNLLTYYPNSLKLLKMKGTLYKKLDDLPLAEKAWVRALELDPGDKPLRVGLARLREKIDNNRIRDDSKQTP